MEPQISEIQILINLGLTLKQAKVYLALLKTGPLKTSEISKISKTDRADAYRTLSTLQQLGLVEKIITTPLMYRATPINEAATRLLESKTEWYEKLRAETQILLEQVKTEKQNSAIQLEASDFVLIPEGKNVIGRIRTAIEQAQDSIDLVLSWKRFSQGFAHAFAESLEVAWAKNVKVRFIVENPAQNKTVMELIQCCRGKPFCQARFIRRHPETVFGLYDEKQVFVIVFPKKDLPGSPALWSNNSGLIALAKGYFEMLWQSAMESVD